MALNWDNRYILNASLRCDGSSRFSKGHRYGYFPSASLAWRVVNEEFFPKNTIINDAKLRLSWGKTGSMAGVGNFAALSLIGAGGASYNEAAGFQISQDARDLTWEKANQYNIGVDLDLWQSRLSFTGDIFLQRTTDLLYSKPVLAATGYTSIPSNIGTLENRGLELALTGKIFTGEFKWTLSGNISFIKNKLVKLIDGSDMIVMGAANDKVGGSMHALINGQPLSTYYMLRMDGIYQRDDQVPAKLYAKGVRAGDVRYFDANNDGDITEDDRINVGKAAPDFYGGITSNFSYKGFDLSIFGQFSVGGKIMAGWRGVGAEGTEAHGIVVLIYQGRRQQRTRGAVLQHKQSSRHHILARRRHEQQYAPHDLRRRCTLGLYQRQRLQRPDLDPLPRGRLILQNQVGHSRLHSAAYTAAQAQHRESASVHDSRQSAVPDQILGL